MHESSSVNWLWETIRSPQTYKNLGYLMLALPTGLLYFIPFVIGLTLGLGTLVIGIGVLILFLTFAGSIYGARIERWLANNMLGANIPPLHVKPFSINSISNRDNWRGMVFLFFKMPLGIITFIFTTGVLSFVLALITVPFTYSSGFVSAGAREIDTLFEALIASGFGLILAPLALLVLNRIATMWRRFATSMLTGHSNAYKNRAALERDVYERLRNRGYADEDNQTHTDHDADYQGYAEPQQKKYKNLG